MPSCADGVLGTQGLPRHAGESVKSFPTLHREAKQWPISHMPRVFSPLCAKIHVQDFRVSPFSRGSSQLRDRTQVSCIAGGFFTS